MSVILEFTVPADACALGRSLRANPEMTIELDRVIPTGDTVMPFFWVWGSDPGSFAELARSESAIERLTTVDRVADGELFAAEWDREAAGTLRGIVNTGGTILHAGANASEWTFELRFSDDGACGSFQSFCLEHGVPISLTRLTTQSRRRDDHHFGLTVEQRQALAVAYDAGFFNEPRDVTLADLAARLDISPRAVAGRIRRAHAALIEATGVAETTPPP